MRAQRVRRRHDGVVRDESQRARCRAVVVADQRGVRLEIFAAGDRAPERDRAEHEVRHEDERNERLHDRPLEARGREDGRREERGHERRDVVEVDRGLRVRRGEQVEGEVRQRGQQRERCGERQERERNEQHEEVREAVEVEGRAHDRQRVGDERLQDPGRRAADLFVPSGERVAAVVVVRDDAERERGGRRPRDRDRDPRDAPSSRERVPEAEPGDGQRRSPPSSCTRAPRRSRTEGDGPRRGTRTRTAATGTRARRGGTPRARATASRGRAGTRARSRVPRARSRGACARASRRAARRARSRSPA